MSKPLRITHVDILEGDTLVADLSDGSTVQVTLKQLLSLDPAQPESLGQTVPSGSI